MTAIKPTGRPRIELDDRAFEQVVALARLHCTRADVAQVLGMSVSTLHRRLVERGHAGFDSLYQQGAAEARVRLRALQYQSALNGDVRMLIWLGKQWLGQKDVVEERLVIRQRWGF
jgi:AraC-like DNA-binding protein